MDGVLTCKKNSQHHLNSEESKIVNALSLGDFHALQKGCKWREKAPDSSQVIAVAFKECDLE